MKSCKLLKLIQTEAAVQCATIVNDILFCGTKGGWVNEYKIANNDFELVNKNKYGPVWVNCMTGNSTLSNEFILYQLI
jgi:hypothetical protein